jgi:ribulose-phosphate 3-epimerase
MNIIPGILEQDIDTIVSRIESVLPATRHVQIDVCDGVYVESVTWPYSIGVSEQSLCEGQSKLQRLKQQGVTFELDLMIQNPEATLVDWLGLGPSHIWIHVDSTEVPERCLAILHGYQMDYPKFTYGIAVMNTTPIEKYHKLLRMVYSVQVMGIETVGKQGQVFDTTTFGTIDTLRELDSEVPLHVDGGVSIVNIPELSRIMVAGAVCGSALFGGDDPVGKYVNLVSAIESVHTE